MLLWRAGSMWLITKCSTLPVVLVLSAGTAVIRD